MMKYIVDICFDLYIYTYLCMNIHIHASVFVHLNTHIYMHMHSCVTFYTYYKQRTQNVVVFDPEGGDP